MIMSKTAAEKSAPNNKEAMPQARQQQEPKSQKPTSLNTGHAAPRPPTAAPAPYLVLERDVSCIPTASKPRGRPSGQDQAHITPDQFRRESVAGRVSPDPKRISATASTHADGGADGARATVSKQVKSRRATRRSRPHAAIDLTKSLAGEMKAEANAGETASRTGARAIRPRGLERVLARHGVTTVKRDVRHGGCI